jgi:DtxR family Mn-dependent transcriptional regulator
MPSLTVENYCKAILQLSTRSGDQWVTTGRLAETLGLTPGTVTSMLKTLAESNLATFTPYEGVRLTRAGRALALRILRRHRLIELFLSKTLQLNWDEVHDEAEHMEHAVSDLLIDRIDAYLGYPESDPHGDPIPKADGTVRASTTRTLADCQSGQSFRLTRVLDQSPEFLRYLSETGLELGAEGELVSNRPEAGVIAVRVGRSEATLGREAAAKLLVE